MLEVEALSAGYGRVRVLQEMSFSARVGEVIALVGRNGAGKSTALKALMGLVPAWSGEVHFDGKRIERLEPYEIARRGLGYVPEDRRIFTELTVAENLEVGRRTPGSWSDEAIYGLFPVLGGMRDRRGDRMSGGEQQMLAIARTLAGNPRAILLDEPSEGLAPLVVAAVARAIGELKRAGVTVVLAEQSLRFAERVADRVLRVERGRLA
jgi:branched-chain amino acid transport system ATP-binding protein